MKELFELFNLGDLNPRQGDGILYCIRRHSLEIRRERDAIIAVLQSKNVSAEARVDENIEIMAPSDMDRKELLDILTELSCLNEAVNYINAGYGNIKSISVLKDRFVITYSNLLVKGQLADAYNLVSIAVTQIVKDLRTVHQQKNALTEEDIRTVDELEEWAEEKMKELGRSNNSLVFKS